MSWQQVHLGDVLPSPWKNGGGTTRELVVWPKADPWQWRISVAEVTQSGPFSRFEGIERWFAVLQGEGVVLSTQGVRHHLTTDSTPLRFDGAPATDCELLGGPTRDFNLMTRMGVANATVTRLKGQLTLPLKATEIVAIYSISTGTSAHFHSDSVTLMPHSLAWRIAEQSDVLTVDAQQALVIRVAVAGAVLSGGTNPAKETP